MSMFDDLKCIVTPNDIPMLKEDLEFEVHLPEKDFISPITISFVCDKITHGREDNFKPCCFSVEIPMSDIRIRPGTLQISYGKVIIETINKFLTEIFNCGTEEEIIKRYGHTLDMEAIKSLTDVYERKVITEKTNKKYDQNSQNKSTIYISVDLTNA